ncbi:MAG: NADH-quinone oxidoreductase subunit NuoK [Thermodesulfovibrio sp.]|nr:NADH-quinone oxidoreductase subunit NuoK [Thermodesulfovibrio sp.]
MIPLEAYLVLAGLIFSIGLINLLISRNMIILFISVEVMLAGVNLMLVAMAHYMNDIRGHVLALFSIAVTAGSVAVGLSLLVAYFNLKKSIDSEELRELRERLDG